MCSKIPLLTTCCCGHFSAKVGLILVIGVRCLIWILLLLLSLYGNQLTGVPLKDLQEHPGNSKNEDPVKDAIERESNYVIKSLFN